MIQGRSEIDKRGSGGHMLLCYLLRLDPNILYLSHN